jgi:hypothetical protein
MDNYKNAIHVEKGKGTPTKIENLNYAQWLGKSIVGSKEDTIASICAQLSSNLLIEEGSMSLLTISPL